MHRSLGSMQRKHLSFNRWTHFDTLFLDTCAGIVRAISTMHLFVLSACFSFPLHFTMAENQTSLPVRQQRMGIPKVRCICSLSGLDYSFLTNSNRCCILSYIHQLKFHILFCIILQVWPLAKCS